MLIAPFAPRMAALRLRHASSTAVWANHLGGLAFMTAGAVAIIRAGGPYVGLRGPFTHQLAILAGMSPGVALAFALASVCVGILVAYAVAVGALGWAQRDEPFGDTWRHALATVRYLSPVAAWPAFVLIVLLVHRGRFVARSAAPLILYPPAVTMALVWPIVVLIRVLIAPRPARGARRAPLCERCGYVLLYIDPAGRCPECGTPVSWSLDASKRRCCFDVHGSQDSNSTVWGISWRAWFNARQFFGLLAIENQPERMLRFLLPRLVSAGAIALTTFVLGIAVFVARSAPGPGVLLPLASLCVCILLAFFCLWSLAVGVLGIIASKLYGRNLSGAALSAASLVSGFLPVWAFFAACTIVLGAWLVKRKIFATPFWPVRGWLMFNLAAGALYTFAVWRRIGMLKYANWRSAGALSPD